MRVLGWILMLGGLAILGVEFLQGDGFSLVGAGVAVVGGVVSVSPGSDGSLEGEGDEP